MNSLLEDFMKKLFAALAIAGLSSTMLTAQAEVLTFTASKPTTLTNWTDVLSVSKFNSNLGTLNSITFELGGTPYAPTAVHES